MFVAAQADTDLKPATLARRVVAIGLQRRRATRMPRHRRDAERRRRPGRKRAADCDVTRDMLQVCAGSSLPAHRDRALIAVGMAGAFRRSELVALRLSDLTWHDEGVDVLVRSSKADQAGAGQVVAILDGARLAPVTHLRAWLWAAGLMDGDGGIAAGQEDREVFRGVSRRDRLVDTGMSDCAVALLVKRLAAAAKYDPAGFLTSAAHAKASIFKMQEVSRHKSVDVLAGCVRDAEHYRDHAGKDFL